ncbi:MAG: hypothetical protein WCZ66_01195 [Sphingomonadaceae bacterium]
MAYWVEVMERVVESCGAKRVFLRGAGTIAVALVAVLLPATGTLASSEKVTGSNSSIGYRAKQTESFAAFAPPALGSIDVSKFAFTAPGAVPGRSSTPRTQVDERSFSFTPSGTQERNRKGLSIGVTTRSLTPATASARAAEAQVSPGVAPSGYNVDLSVGYNGFSVSGGVARVDAGVSGGEKRGADVGVSYAGRNWKTGVRASVERGSSLPVAADLLGNSYGVEASGALSLSPGISVGGSLRYRMAPQNPTPLDPSKDERAVLVGGAVAF